MPAFEQHAAEGGMPIVFLSVASSRETRDLLAGLSGSAVVELSTDGSDVRQIERRVASAYRNALAKDDRQEWEDRGWMLGWPAALFALLYFRRGWTMALGLAFAAGLVAGTASPARAEGLEGRVEAWFLTPDQRGRLAFGSEHYDEAAELFQDPMWKGYALAFIGRYDEAAAVFDRVDTADAAFAQGVALIKGRAYRPAITAFEKALERDPGHAGAAQNVEVARAILSYLEELREQTDTEDGSEGADEVVFDKEKKGGTEQTLSEKDRIKVESAEQWMRTVETHMADFLQTRFALEAVEEEQ